jgi:hypothetical protein
MKNKIFDFLLSDFQSIKSEIGRRSNLQRFYIGLYLGAIGLIAFSLIGRDLSWDKFLFCFPIALIFLLIYVREDTEIHRLGEIIIKKIAEPLKKLNNLKIDVIPSETYRGSVKKRNRALYIDLICLWLLFFLGPLLLTGLPFVSVSFDTQELYKSLSMDQKVLKFLLCVDIISAIAIVLILILYFPYKPYKESHSKKIERIHET